ncbi:MAG: penicillin-insensitive murein endopeptidase [Deltaproteobacteria bacterium]
MRLVAVVCSLAALTLLGTSADAKPRREHHHSRATKAKRSAHASPIKVEHHHLAYVPRGPIEGQSLGLPWSGRLHDASELAEGDGYVIRRPGRAFGTRTTVDIIHHALVDFREQFPDAHPIAVGDISQESGGQITQHHSHQSGRDVDIGLVYKTKPASYPQDFVVANADNLDCEATYALLNEFAETAHEDGGAQVIFMDFAVQGLLYHWAQDHGEDQAVLDKLFQYPNRGGDGLVRHVVNHDNHMHVRFKCPEADSSCRN